MDILIESATPDDLPAVETLLNSSNLPLDGLRDHIATLLVARQQGTVVGSAALERYGPAALLRSVVVAPGRRAQGLGQQLVHRALDKAQQYGISEIYLLTTSAATFFTRLGFAPIERKEVHSAVQQSVEFTSACPASAQALRLYLAPGNYTTRAATPADAPAIAAIYNQGIADRVGTFETRLRSVEDIHSWFDDQHPVVVTQSATGSSIAFASTSTYRPRECYAGIAEFSVYVAREWRGRGAGREAMLGLLAAAEAAGFWKLLSRVFVENTASRALLQRLGFREVGIYEKHGQLDGVWRDVVIVERLLDANI